MNEQQVRAIVQSMLSAYTNFTIPQHTHDGVNSQRIPIQNILIVPGVGLPLVNGANAYNLYIDPIDFSLELLPNPALIASGNADFNIGEVGTPFYDVSIETTDEFQSNVLSEGSSNQFSQIPAITNNAVSDGTNSATEQLTPNIKRFTSTDPSFQITINSTNYVPTSTNTTGGGTTPGGTIDIIIDGTTYSVLHT